MDQRAEINLSIQQLNTILSKVFSKTTPDHIFSHYEYNKDSHDQVVGLKLVGRKAVNINVDNIDL